MDTYSPFQFRNVETKAQENVCLEPLEPLSSACRWPFSLVSFLWPFPTRSCVSVFSPNKSPICICFEPSSNIPFPKSATFEGMGRLGLQYNHHGKIPLCSTCSWGPCLFLWVFYGQKRLNPKWIPNRSLVVVLNLPNDARVVVTPNHIIILLLLYSCNFLSVMNHKTNIC